MIFSIDLSDVQPGDHLIITLEVESIVRTSEKTTVRFKKHVVPTEVDYKGDPTFEASSHRITVT